jgi:HK97 gp10 family phage protein
MTFVRIDTSEVHDLASDMRRHAAIVEPDAGRIVAKVAYDIVATAQTIVPVDTGNLKNSIGASIGALEATVSATTEYADYVEYGTSRMSPQPYMGPAFAKHEPKLEKALGQLGGRVFGR